VFDKFKDKRVHFVSYECASVYIPAAYVKDLEDIFDFLKGDVDIGKFLRGKAVGAFFAEDSTVATAAKERFRARRRIADGRRHLAENELERASSAFLDATRLDRDNAEAHFLLGMVRILNEDDVENILGDLKRAQTLDPENPVYSLTIAKIYHVLDQMKEAIKYLYDTVEVDPANREARELLDALRDRDADTEG